MFGLAKYPGLSRSECHLLKNRGTLENINIQDALSPLIYHIVYYYFLQLLLLKWHDGKVMEDPF